jgi:predicted nucleic acid-binding Zn ribbon protein
MPTYVYRFLDCDGTIEVQQSFTDPALTEAVCPDDGLVHPVKKVFTPVGVTFKGNGFYKTDSRGSGSSASAGRDGKASGDSKAASDASPAKTSESGSKDTSSKETKSSSDSSGATTSTPSSDKKSHAHGDHTHTH